VLAACAVCGRELPDGEAGLAFSPAVGGLVCRECQPTQRERMPIGVEARRLLRDLGQPGEPWRISPPNAARVEVRRLLGQYVTWLMGHRPRLLPYLNHLS
jgi:recombinational DNA repair protein (RecF pathway)